MEQGPNKTSNLSVDTHEEMGEKKLRGILKRPKAHASKKKNKKGVVFSEKSEERGIAQNKIATKKLDGGKKLKKKNYNKKLEYLQRNKKNKWKKN